MGGREEWEEREREEREEGREREERQEGRERERSEEVGGKREEKEKGRRGKGRRKGRRVSSGHTVQISSWSLMKEKDFPRTSISTIRQKLESAKE